MSIITSAKAAGRSALRIDADANANDDPVGSAARHRSRTSGGVQRMNAADLVPLGSRGGYDWFTGKPTVSSRNRTPLELRENKGTTTDADGFPAGPFVQFTDGDGVIRYRTFTFHDPGTFAAPNIEGPTPKAQRARRPVDGIRAIELARKAELVVPLATPAGPDFVEGVRGTVLPSEGLPMPKDPGAKPYAYRGPQSAVRGAAAIVAKLERRGYTFALSTDSAHLVVSAPGGRCLDGDAAAIEQAMPLLLAHLQGDPLLCVVSAHESPADAVTLALGGAPWCGSCAP